MESTSAVSASTTSVWKRRLARVNVSELIMPAFILVYTGVIADALQSAAAGTTL